MIINGERYHLSVQQKLLRENNKINKKVPFVKALITLKSLKDERNIIDSFVKIINKHEILRTSCKEAEEGQNAFQSIQEKSNISYHFYDSSNDPEEENKYRVQKIWNSIEYGKNVPGVNCMFHLFKSDESNYHAIIAIPLLFCDTYSMRLLIDQWIMELNGDELEELDIVQYVDYCAWQQDSYAFSNEHVVNLDDSSELNLSNIILGKSTDDLSDVLSIPKALVEKVKSFAERWAVNEESILLAGWYMMLHRLTSNDNIKISYLFEGRPADELNKAVGLYERMQSIPVSLDGTTSLKDISIKVQEKIKELEYYSYKWSSNEVQTKYKNQQEPGSTFVFRFDKCDRHSIRENINIESIETKNRQSQYVEVNTYHFNNEDIEVSIHYDMNSYSGEQIRLLLHQYLFSLKIYVAEPYCQIARLPILKENQVDWMLSRLNNPSHRQERSINNIDLNVKTVIDEFKSQVDSTPDAIAVSWREQEISYRQLNKDVNRIASYLVERLKPEEFVGILSEKSYELIVSILAVMKAGGVIVYLNPNHPPEKNDGIVRLTNMKYIITNLSHPQSTISQSVEWIIQNDAKSDFLNVTNKYVEKTISPNSLAYVLFTSGTTEMPKGVMIEHRSLMNYIQWVNNKLLDINDTSVPFISDLNFDSYLKQFFAPLLSGKKVILLDADESNDPDAMLQAVKTVPFHSINCVPSYWDNLLTYMEQDEVDYEAKIKLLLLGGEQVTESLLRRTRDRFPDIKIINLYGPTEATANATYAELKSAENVIIGQPVSNMHAVVLDSYLNPVPFNVRGELYIWGEGLARGYLNQPDQTSMTFIPNFLSDVPGERLYKTGDLVKMNHSGDLEYCGRVDNMVKIHGVRVELDEVQQCLNRMKGIKHSVILENDQQLIGYYVAENENITDKSVKEYLESMLPSTFIPSQLIKIDHLPLNDVGKIDYQMLKTSVDKTSYDPPKTPIENMVAEIWSSVLNKDQISRQDDFFFVGGHSLTATQVTSRVRRYTNKSIPLRLIFDHSRLSSYADAVSEYITEPIDSLIEPVK